MVLKSINIRLPSCSEKRPDLLKNLIWRVCISIGCEFAYFNNNLPSFCLICAQLAIQITLSWIDYHRFNKPFIICRYNNGTSLDKGGIKVLFLEIGVAQLVINFIPLYIPVLNTRLKRVFPLFTFKTDCLFGAPFNSLLPARAAQADRVDKAVSDRVCRLRRPIAEVWEEGDTSHPFLIPAYPRSIMHCCLMARGAIPMKFNIERASQQAVESAAMQRAQWVS